MAQATAYLNATSGLFLSTGVGLVGYKEDVKFFGSTSGNAFGFSGRLGIELPLGAVSLSFRTWVISGPLAARSPRARWTST